VNTLNEDLQMKVKPFTGNS